jgi:hypothetical protein
VSELKTISAFEYVFMERYEPKKAKLYRAETPAERDEKRRKNLQAQADKIKIP